MLEAQPVKALEMGDNTTGSSEDRLEEQLSTPVKDSSLLPEEQRKNCQIPATALGPCWVETELLKPPF